MEKRSCKELLMQRMLFAIISSIIVQFLFVSSLLLITNLSTDYTTWVWHTWSTITSFKMWSYFVVLATITFLQGVVCSKTYLSSPPYLKSRFAKLCGVLTSQNIVLACLYVAIGAVLVWSHLCLEGRYGSLVKTCETSYGNCLTEEHCFLLLSGAWSGLYFFGKSKAYQENYEKFPVIPLTKFFRFKNAVYSKLPSIAVASVWPTFYYLNAYYFLGAYFRAVVLFLTTARMEDEPLDSLTRILNFSLIFRVWLYQLIFILTIDSMRLLFEVYLTEWTPFDIKESAVYGGDTNGLTLAEVLSMDKLPIMQHLGYLDLLTIAQKDKYRRTKLFTLSQPGGHPYNWNCTVERVVDLLKAFTDRLNSATAKPQDHNLTTQQSTTTTVLNNYQKDYSYRMRNLVSEEPTTGVEESVKPAVEPFLLKLIKTKWHNFLNYLMSKPLVNYIFGEQEAAKVCYVLFGSQSVIWASDAISLLAVLSLTEDAYGIVQKDLPDIIKSLLNLKQSLDKLHKSNILAKKQFGDDDFVRKLFNSLRAAVKRSLYRIVTNYESYIADIPLEPHATEQLQQFLNYRE